MSIEELRGISKEKEVIIDDRTPLFLTLREIGMDYVKKVSDDPRTRIYYYRFGKKEDKLVKEYDSIREELANDKLKDVIFSETDIVELISNPPHFIQYHETPESIVYGMFTGSLLDILTTRNEEMGKRTIISLDGNGTKSIHLFAFARNVDTLILENYNDSELVPYLGSFGGKVDTLIIKNCYHSDMAFRLGYNNGKVKNLVLANNQWHGMAKEVAAKNGLIELAISSWCSDGDLFHGMAIDGGLCKLNMIHKCFDTSFEACDDGSGTIEKVILKERYGTIFNPTYTDPIIHQNIKSFTHLYQNPQTFKQIFNSFKTNKQDKRLMKLVQKVDFEDNSNIIDGIAKIRKEYFSEGK